jgi:peptidoglycan/xylan/chitin deacetylase (PgdA/CDA1 family)
VPRRLARSLQPLVPSARSGVWILGFHLVGAGTESPVDLPVADFRALLDGLRSRAEVVSLAEALQALESRRTLVRRLVVITFDDAYHNFLDRAWTVLSELDLPATLFVPVNFVEGRSGPPMRGTEGMPPLGWQELRELTTAGVTVGSHGLSHHELPRLPDTQAEREVAESRRRLEERLETPVDTFCYPRGMWSRRVERIVARHYRFAAVGGGRRLTRGGFSPLRLWRVPVRRDGEPADAVVGRRVWVEEWLADKARRYLQ